MQRYRTPPRFGGRGSDRDPYERRGRWDRSPPRRSRSRSRERRRRFSPDPAYRRQRSRERAKRRSYSAELRERSLSPTRGEKSHRRSFSPEGRSGRSANSEREQERYHRMRNVERMRRESSSDSERPPSKREMPKYKSRRDRSRSRSRSESPSARPYRSRHNRSPEDVGKLRSRNRNKNLESEDSTAWTSRETSRHKLRESYSSSPQEPVKPLKSSDKHSQRKELASPTLPSKWARHRDSADSSSEEDRELEKAFQQGRQSGASESDEDMFGIAELSRKYFSKT